MSLSQRPAAQARTCAHTNFDVLGDVFLDNQTRLAVNYIQPADIQFNAITWTNGSRIEIIQNGKRQLPDG